MNHKVIIVLPAFNAQKTLLQTINAIPNNCAQEIILVDDASTDNTLALAKKLKLTHHRHNHNLGYGANQKTCYRLALKHQASIVVMLHPDYQYDPKLIPHLIDFIKNDYFDIMLGSRIRTRREAIAGGMPVYKYYANRILTLIQNVATGNNLSEWHTGFRAYSHQVLTTIPFNTFSDDFVFDTQMLLSAIKHKFRIGDIPVPVRYTPQSSSIGFWRSLSYGLSSLWETLRYALSS